MRQRSDRPRDLTDAHVFGSVLEAVDVALDLRIPVGKFQPKRCGLCMNSMRASNGRRVLELECAPLQDSLECFEAIADDEGSLVNLQRLRSVHYVVRSQAEV